MSEGMRTSKGRGGLCAPGDELHLRKRGKSLGWRFLVG